MALWKSEEGGAGWAELNPQISNGVAKQAAAAALFNPCQNMSPPQALGPGCAAEDLSRSG